jgi:RNA polymerase sigma factor (sigma-70 family)
MRVAPEGVETTVEEIYRSQHERLWWSLLAYTGDRDVASDAVAEAFARALRAGASIRDPAAWIWRVAFRVASAELRERGRRTEITDIAYEIDDRALGVVAALKRLSDRQRATFILFYLEDRSTKEITDVLGMREATVYVHLHRARRRLRELLEDPDVEGT